MNVLIIDAKARAEIAEALTKARADPVRWADIKDFVTDAKQELLLKDRKPGFKRLASQHIVLGGYRASISFEEQPAGLFRHLSISSPHPGSIPHPAVIEMVATEFGFPDFPPKNGRVWLEEFEPNHMAVNVIDLENETQ